MQGAMGNIWSFLAGCGVSAAIFFWTRNGQGNMPQWAKQPMEQMGNTAQQVAGTFNPQA